ncbi:MAG: histidine--tRNA ligase [bacterium]|nr:histidine--tRNA ligase [Candidatus Aquidulcis frankliniae]
MSGFQSPRGLRDLLEPLASAHGWVTDRAWAAADAAGYARIELPIAEESALFERAVGGTSDIVAKELYRLEPRGDDAVTLALRPEATAGAVRAYIQHGMRSQPQPVRLATVAQLFRYDRPQKGRYRQFTQFDLEAIGDGGPGIDVEVIELGATYLRGLGLSDVQVHLNSVGCANCRPAYVESLRAHFTAVVHELSEVDQSRLATNPLRLLDSKEPAAVNRAASAPAITDHLCAECAAHHTVVTAGLATVGIAVVAAPLLVRGLDYYTRTAWEYLLPGEQGQQGALGGGGRYDGLVEQLGGTPTPAIGFAIGIDRVVLALEARGLLPATASGPAIVVAGIEPESVADRVAIASQLRTAGASARADVSTRKIGKQLEGAVRDGALAVIIVEPDGRLTLRDLVKASQAEPAERGSVIAAALRLVQNEG